MGIVMTSGGGAARSVYAEEAAGTSMQEQVTKVYTDGEEAGELTLRFYEDTPHIPYLGIGAYSQYLKEQPLTMKKNEDGTCALVNSIGEELMCDPDAGVIVVKDWARFFDMPLPR